LPSMQGLRWYNRRCDKPTHQLLTLAVNNLVINGLKT
jgi:hypothetical protein